MTTPDAPHPTAAEVVAKALRDESPRPPSYHSDPNRILADVIVAALQSSGLLREGGEISREYTQFGQSFWPGAIPCCYEDGACAYGGKHTGFRVVTSWPDGSAHHGPWQAVPGAADFKIGDRDVS